MFFALRRSHHTASFCAKILQVNRGHATHLPFSLKIHESAHCLLRSRHTPAFFAKNLQVGTFSPATKGIPCAFFVHKRVTMQAQHEKHMSKNMSGPNSRLHSSETLLPFHNVVKWVGGGCTSMENQNEVTEGVGIVFTPDFCQNSQYVFHTIYIATVL